MNWVKLSGYYWAIFGGVVGLFLFYAGHSRISAGISILRRTDEYTAHYASVGLLYTKIALIILIVLAISITYSIKK